MEKRVLTKNELNWLLLGMLGSADLVDRWWHSPNKAFAGNTPLELYQKNLDGQQQVSDYVGICAFGGGG